ncbi:MurR/RpiR family transcriptional regulator [Telmatospirillum sp. J64-1]|uniref:MurR/RpiR family transcriptional regulator n=1 Tax=Telmatospirillum sp. J64-1 TaxID=2502183 RepID=UPI0021054DC4|nr:MurR/RpiR family transcriptional regulator [Telmatospirillum sp. J64-1]
MAEENETCEHPGAAPGNFEALKQVIGAQYDGLSKRLKQIADFALSNPNAMAFKTVAEIGAEIEVAPSALIRFAKALGYSGFSELQAVFQERLSGLAPSYRDRIRHLKSDEASAQPLSLMARFTEGAIEALRHLQEETPAEHIERAAEIMASSRMIHVVANRRTFPAAFYLSYNLNRLEVPTHLLDGVGGTLNEQTALIGPQDCLVAFSFRPYAKETLAVVEKARAIGASVITITDSARHPFAAVDICFEVAEASVTSFRSLNATMSLALILAIRTGQRCETSED